MCRQMQEVNKSIINSINHNQTCHKDSRCRASAQSVMGHWIDPSWWTHCAISYSSQCSTAGVTKVVGYVILSVGWCI